MSIEKLTEQSRSYCERVPFTQISNEVILNIKDNDAFRVYCYLQSKTREWKVIKENVKNVCNVGDRKMKQIFSYLNRCGLIEYRKLKDDKGKMIRVDILVLNGTRFDPNTPFDVKEEQKPPTNEKLSTYPQTTGAGTARVENRTCGNDGLLNKDITKERKKQNRDFVDKKTNTASSYVNRNTISEEFKQSEKGNVKIAEHYLSQMKGIHLKRYRKKEEPCTMMTNTG